MKCSVCESTKTLKTVSIPSYKYRECGLENVILHGVKESRCEDCGESYISFGDMEKLHALIAGCLIKKSDNLIGKEIKFLRKFLGYSGSVFSQLVGYEPEHLSRVESGKASVQVTFDHLVRSLVARKFPDRDYDLHDLFIEGKAMKLEWLEFSLSGKEWKAA